MSEHSKSLRICLDRKQVLMAVSAAAILMAGAPALADSTQGITPKAIKVANIGPYTGSGAPVSPINYGIEAYLRYINAQGGVDGRKFESIMSDDNCNEAMGIAAAKKAIYEDKVFALLGPSCSGPAMAAKPTVEREKMIWIGGAGDPRVATPVVAGMFQVNANGNVAGAAMARFAIEKKDVKKVALVQHSTEWSRGSCVPAANKLKAAGIEVVADVALERGANDASAQVLQIKSKGAQMVMGCLYQPELVVLLRDMRRFGVSVPLIGAFGSDLKQVAEQVKDVNAVKGIFFLPYPFQALLTDAKMKPMRDILTTYLTAGELPRQGEPTDLYYYGLQIAIAFVEGVKRAGPDLTRDKWIAAMEGLKNFDTKIFADNITLSSADHVGIMNTAYIGIDEGGKPALYERLGVPLANK